MKNAINRRDFMRLSSLFGAAITMQPLHALSINDPWQLQKGAPQKVIILGAGLAGLSAGMELQKLGHQVQIIEGQMRAGGRVFTARNMFADGLFADVGAARIPENHEWTMKYIKKYGLQLMPFSPSNNDYLHVMNGKKIRYTSAQPAQLDQYPVSLTEQELELGLAGISGKIFEALSKGAGNPSEASWPPPSIAHFDKYTFKEYLVNQNMSPMLADILMIGWEQKHGMKMSVIELFRELNLSFGAPRNKIVGGNDLLPRAIAADLGGIIQYGTRVLDIDQDEMGVSIAVEKGGERTTMKADRVICTFPLPVLQKMDFVKTLSKTKQRAINEMGSWNLSRTVVQVSDRYWKKEGFNGFAATDRPTEIWDPHYESNAKRGMIAAYIKNTDSNQFLNMTDIERMSFSKNLINSAFPGLEQYAEGGYTKVWAEDPWAGYAHVIGNQQNTTVLQPHLGTPEGRIHFAGEHASAYHGWIQGAIESGNRTAKEVNGF